MPTTQRGRVVYNRPIHYFTYADVLRIVRKVDPLTTVKRTSEAQAELGNARAALFAILADIRRARAAQKWIFDLDFLNDLVRRFFAEILDLASFVPEARGRFRQMIVNFMRGV